LTHYIQHLFRISGFQFHTRKGYVECPQQGTTGLGHVQDFVLNRLTDIDKNLGEIHH